MENEKLPEHERSHLGEHLYMLLSFVLSLGSASSKLEPLLDRLSAEAGCALAGGRPLTPEAELPGSLGLLGKCEALERKTVTFENIVCVLNREVEKVSLVAEAASRQHLLDQEKIEALSAKVGRGFVAPWWDGPGARGAGGVQSGAWCLPQLQSHFLAWGKQKGKGGGGGMVPYAWIQLQHFGTAGLFTPPPLQGSRMPLRARVVPSWPRCGSWRGALP